LPPPPDRRAVNAAEFGDLDGAKAVLSELRDELLGGAFRLVHGRALHLKTCMLAAHPELEDDGIVMRIPPVTGHRKVALGAFEAWVRRVNGLEMPEKA
jgi:hypothetical protein